MNHEYNSKNIIIDPICYDSMSISKLHYHEQLKQYATSLKGLKKAELKTVIYKIAQPASVLYYVRKWQNMVWFLYYRPYCFQS